MLPLLFETRLTGEMSRSFKVRDFFFFLINNENLQFVVHKKEKHFQTLLCKHWMEVKTFSSKINGLTLGNGTIYGPFEPSMSLFGFASNLISISSIQVGLFHTNVVFNDIQWWPFLCYATNVCVILLKPCAISGLMRLLEYVIKVLVLYHK